MAKKENLIPPPQIETAAAIASLSALRDELSSRYSEQTAREILYAAGQRAGGRLVENIQALSHPPASFLEIGLLALKASGLGNFEIQPAARGRTAVIIGKKLGEVLSSSSSDCAFTAGLLGVLASSQFDGKALSCEWECDPTAGEVKFILKPQSKKAANDRPASTIPLEYSRQTNLLETMFEKMPLGIAIFDTQLRLQRMNPTFARLVQTYDSAICDAVPPSTPLRDLLPEAFERLEPSFQRALQGEIVSGMAIPTPHNGKIAYWDGLIAPLRDGDRVVGVLNVINDATARISTEEKLRTAIQKLQENESALRSLVENATRFAVYRVQLDPTAPGGARVVLASPSLREIVGMDDPYDFSNWFRNIHPDDEERVLEANRRSLELGEVYNQTARVFNPRKQRWCWVQTVSTPTLDAAGKITHFDGFVIDISDQKQAEEDLQKAFDTLEQRVQERTRELTTLLAVQQALTSRLDLDAVLKLIADEAERLTGADLAAVLVVDGAQLRTVTVSNGKRPDLIGYRVPIEKSLTGSAVRTGQSVLVTDALTDPRIPAEIAPNVARSSVSVPMISGKEAIGAITVMSDSPAHFGPDVQRLLSLLASSAVIGLDNARLYRGEQDRRHVAESLRDILDVINSNLPLEDILATIVRQANDLLGASSAMIRKVDFEEMTASTVASYNLPPEFEAVRTTPFYMGKSDQLLMNRQPSVVSDLQAEFGDIASEGGFIDEQEKSGTLAMLKYFRSMLKIPLFIRDDLYGAITFFYKNRREFNPDDLKLAMTLGDQISLAIENARLHQQEQERRREAERRREVAELLREIVRFLNTNRSLDEMLQYIVRSGAQIMRSTACMIRRVNEETDEIETVAEFNLPQDFEMIRVTPFYRSAVDERLMDKNPVPIADLQGYYSPFLAHPRDLAPRRLAGIQATVRHFRSALKIPLFVKDSLYGALTFFYDEPQVFNEENIGMAMTLGDQIALVIENARLYEQELERRQEAERRQKVAESLRDILGALNSSLPQADILGLIVQQAGQLLGSDSTVLFRIDPFEYRIEVQASCNLPEELAKISVLSAHDLELDRNNFSRALFSRKPYFIADIRNYTPTENLADGADLLSDLRSWQEGAQRHYRAFLTVPLIVNEEIYGSLGFYFHELRSFNEEDIHLASLYGDQAALAIENARLRSQAEQSAVLAERSRLARELHDAVTQTLFSASLIAEVLPRLWNRSQEEGLRRLEELRQLTRGALAEMRTLLLELRPSALLEANLNELFRHLCDAFAGRARIPVELSIEGDSNLPEDVKVAIYRIAQEALNNVYKHAEATRVKLTFQGLANRVEMVVEDDGRGFDPLHIPPEHLGVGIMRERAESIDAILAISSKPGKGTRIRVVWRRPAGAAARPADGE